MLLSDSLACAVAVSRSEEEPVHCVVHSVDEALGGRHYHWDGAGEGLQHSVAQRFELRSRHVHISAGVDLGQLRVIEETRLAVDTIRGSVQLGVLPSGGPVAHNGEVGLARPTHSLEGIDHHLQPLLVGDAAHIHTQKARLVAEGHLQSKLLVSLVG